MLWAAELFQYVLANTGLSYENSDNIFAQETEDLKHISDLRFLSPADLLDRRITPNKSGGV